MASDPTLPAVAFCVESYCEEHRRLLRDGHYLAAPPPGALFAVAARPEAPGLFGPVASGRLVGVLLVGRPVARMLPQDGTWGEVIRLVLDRAPYATASRMLRYAADVARARGMKRLISYHDRTRHTGCIYKKAGFRKGRKTKGCAAAGWGSRSGRAQSVSSQSTPKRRRELDL